MLLDKIYKITPIDHINKNKLKNNLLFASAIDNLSLWIIRGNIYHIEKLKETCKLSSINYDNSIRK